MADIVSEIPRAFIEGVMETIGIGISILSPNMEVLFINKRMREWFPHIDTSKKPLCYHVFNEPSREGICSYCPTCKTLQDGEVHESITDTPAGDTFRKYRIVSSPLRDNEGNITAAIEVVEDITEIKKMEEQLIQAQKMEAIGQLAGGIAHDFNNILSAIINYNYIMRDMSPGDPQYPDAVDKIFSLADRASHITRSLLTYSRKQLFELTSLNLNTILKNIDQLLSKFIGEDVELVSLPSENDLVIMADKTHIEQCVMNLATNARDAMPNGGKVTIKTEAVEMDEDFILSHGFGVPGAFAMMSFTDTGMGIDEETRQKIFEPFFTTKEVGKGTGLGLSMIYGIIKQHNGYIDVYSKPGIGTTFRLYFPLIKENIEFKKQGELTPVTGGVETT